MRFTRITTVLPAAVLMAAAGCGSKPAASLPATYPVVGTVQYEGGERLTGGAVQFQSQNDRGITALGEVQEDGSFVLVLYVEGERIEGTVEGLHDVTVMPPDPGDQTAIPVTLSEPYNVEAGENRFVLIVPRL